MFAPGYDPRDEEFTVVESNPTLLNLTLRESRQLESHHPHGENSAPLHGHDVGVSNSDLLYILKMSPISSLEVSEHK